jgi:hypothetical protein
MKSHTPVKPAPSATVSETLSGMARAWERFWFAPANPTTLCVIRVAAGLVALYVMISYSFELLSFVGPHGWVDTTTMDFVRHKITINMPRDDWEPGVKEYHGHILWSIFYHMRDPFWIWAFHGAAIAVAFLFAIGLWTRITSVLIWMITVNYTQRALTNTFGMDTMLNIALLYLMIGPSGACLSVDRLIEIWKAKRKGLAAPPVQPSASANFAIRLFQIHFCIIYLSSGFSKLMGTTWWTGTALWRTFLNYTFAPMENPAYMATLTWLAKHRLLWEIFMSGGVIFTFWTEIGFPFLVWLPKMRWIMLISAVLLHTGIGLFMGLVMFSMLMMILAFSFAPPEQVEAVLNQMYAHLLRLLGYARRVGDQPRPVPGVSGA